MQQNIKRQNSLLKPTGPYQVGIKKYYLRDVNRVHHLYPEGRLIPIQIYFPIKKGTHKLHPKILEENAPTKFPPFYVNVYSRLSNISKLMKGLHSLIILSPGQDSAMTDYGTITEELASHGYIVVTIQHHLAIDDVSQQTYKGRSISRHANIIDNILYVFEWLKANVQIIFNKKINCNKVTLVGFSMGANALLMLANRTSKVFTQEKEDTLLPHDKNLKDVKECIIILDADFAYPNYKQYPILFLLSEEREEYQRSLGTYNNLVKLGYQVHYYKGTKHISFMDQGYVEPIEHEVLKINYFNGTLSQRRYFVNKLRRDILDFLYSNEI